MKTDFIGLTARRAECESPGKQHRQNRACNPAHWDLDEFSNRAHILHAVIGCDVKTTKGLPHY
jgi:hypothetical protein